MKDKKEIRTLKDKLTILQQEFKTLGKRPISVELIEDSNVKEVVTREVKRRRLSHEVVQ